MPESVIVDQSERHERLIQAFLLDPTDRNLRPILRWTLLVTRLRLQTFKKQGWRLPLEQFSGNDPIGDLAIDICGEFFSRSSTGSYDVIFDFLERQGVVNLAEADPARLAKMYVGLLYSFVRQSCYRQAQGEHPLAAKIRRNIKAALKSDEYREVEGIRCSGKAFTLSSGCGTVESGPKIVSMPSVREAARIAFQGVYNYAEWVRATFSRLTETEPIAVAVQQRDLVTAMIAVRFEVLEGEGIPSPAYSDPQKDRWLGEARESEATTLIWVEEHVVSRYAEDQRLSGAEAEKFIEAIRNRLDDFCYCDEVDQLPKYLYELFPGLSPQDYQQRYKYIFEMCVEKAEEYFRQTLRKRLHLIGNDTTFK